MSEFAHLEVYLEQLCRHHPAWGVALAIVRGTSIVYAHACGHSDEQLLTLDTPLAVASLTKPVFAYLALKLCERGVLDLDTPLAQYLPEVYLPNEPYLHLITARHALSHTTGFPNWRDMSGLGAVFCPGSAFHYSTEGLLYLQTVIEHLTRQSLADSMRQNVFTPFGMAASGLIPEDLSAYQPHLPSGLRAYGGLSLHTTAPDYARFLLKMFCSSGGDEFHLTSTTLTHMLTPHIQVGDQQQLSWGLGWGIQQAEPEDSFWHFGVKRGRTFNFVLGYPIEQSGVVILTSQATGLGLCEDIAHIVWEDSRSLPAFQWLLPPECWRADGRKFTTQKSSD